MWEGALILAIGIVIGWLGCAYAPKTQKTKSSSWDKYKNQDGLYSRKAMREAR